MAKGKKSGKSLMGGKGKPNFMGGSALNYGKGSGSVNATPGSTYHAPSYGGASTKKTAAGKGC